MNQRENERKALDALKDGPTTRTVTPLGSEGDLAYSLAYIASLLGAMQQVVNLHRKPDALHSFLKTATYVARCAKQVAEGAKPSQMDRYTE